ncbi:MAG: acyl-CoA dehydratase activase [Syntrophales bacterium]|nr:acyl-CoA dehydratase activase [Syntrophales bacterium]
MLKAEGYYLGVDLGSVSLDGMVVDGAGRVLWHSYRKVQGRSWDAVAMLCRQLWQEWLRPSGISSFNGAMATGSGKEIVQEMLGIPAVNEIVAHGTAAAQFAGGRASVIEIGGQDSKFILVDEKGPYDYAMNELCAAGTGAFLDVQAERLGLSIEELSALAAGAETVPAMAGRCSVFAKSDIIHLQQRGVPVDQIVAGLCHALARNYVANLIRGREVVKPVVFQGGVALNDGVIRAFQDILSLAEADIIRPEMPHMAGALGAALLSAGLSAGLDAAVVEGAAAQAPAGNGQGEGFITRGWQLDEAAARMLKGLESIDVIRSPAAGEKVFIGLDIGSISTKAVALTSAGELLAEVYIFTAGKPLEAAGSALGCLAQSIPEPAIAAVGVTGSGRKLVGHAVGADLVVDEITAQAKGAWLGSPEADTVIEIGGQDAKFIRLGQDGTVLDFEMNRACSAGTGSFIQEQAVRLGVDLKEDYAELALSSVRPLPFTSRCTVFMESDLVHHIQQGVPLPDLLMGVSQAVVENYIDRVVQGRSFGRQVVLQGGVAKNRAVVQAFRNRLKGMEVVVHGHPGISGAIGMAALTIGMFRDKSASEPGFTTSFKGFRFSTTHRESTFECSGCENRCQVSSFQFQEGRFHFGDLCGRYSEAISGLTPGRDLTPDMTQAAGDDGQPENFIATTVGIPRALLFREFYPFWQKYFQQLAIRIKVSAPSSNGCLSLALTRLPAETCLPVKLLFGHVASLEKEGVDVVFLPSMTRLLDGVSCPYIQHGASMVSANFDSLTVVTLPLLPDLPIREREKLSLRVAELFGVERAAADRAYEAAAGELTSWRKSIEYDPRTAGPREKPLAVLLGKPYNIGDRFANMSLAAKLAKAGFDVISYEQLSASLELPLPSRYNSITWAFSRRMLKIGIWISSAADIYPVVVGNFGCGPDSFTFPLLQEIFAERPSLFLEFDEHRADAGLATRVEAFAHRVASWREKAGRGRSQGKGEKITGARKKRAGQRQPPEKATEYILPYFSDHAHAFAGAIRAEGVRARVLPLPDHSTYEAAVEFSGGKQCHPFQLIAGDLIKLARCGDLPEGAAYLLPTLESNCMITQYVPTIQLYMDRLHRNDVRVINANSLELFERFGAVFVFKLGKAILGIEYLSRMRFEMRPYETEKGAVDRAYFAALDIILQSQLDNKINRGIMRAAQLLNAVPTRKRGGKPVIAVTGDVYTRVNPVANGGLFDLLEELGCEVWPSPTLIDVIMTGQEVRARQFWEAGKTLNMMSSWGRVLVNNLGAGFVGKNFQGRLANFSEPHAEEVLRYTEGILPGEPELLVSLNVAKHVDFANKGVDGILNVYCLNCLVGTTTTSVFKRLTERVAGVPIMPLVFDAMGRTHMRNRVEAFVHRVERNREEKLDRLAAAAGPDRGNGGGHVARLKELLDQKLSDVKMPNMKLSEIKFPDMRMPQVRLPEGLWGWKKKKESDTEVYKE